MAQNSQESGSQSRFVQGFRDYFSKENNYTPKRFRALFPALTHADLFGRVSHALFPWSRVEYPGKQRLNAWLFGASVEVTRKLARRQLEPGRVLSIAGRVRAKIAELEALAEELEAYAALRKNAAVRRKG